MLWMQTLVEMNGQGGRVVGMYVCHRDQVYIEMGKGPRLRVKTGMVSGWMDRSVDHLRKLRKTRFLKPCGGFCLSRCPAGQGQPFFFFLLL